MDLKNFLIPFTFVLLLLQSNVYAYWDYNGKWIPGPPPSNTTVAIPPSNNSTVVATPSNNNAVVATPETNKVVTPNAGTVDRNFNNPGVNGKNNVGFKGQLGVGGGKVGRRR